MIYQGGGGGGVKMAKTSVVFKKVFFHVRFEICYFHGLDSAFQKVLHWTKLDGHLDGQYLRLWPK